MRNSFKRQLINSPIAKKTLNVCFTISNTIINNIYILLRLLKKKSKLKQNNSAPNSFKSNDRKIDRVWSKEVSINKQLEYNF